MYKNKKILGIITARGGSKGILEKNIKELGYKPLIAYSIESAQKSKFITDLILSTDDKNIIRVARKYEVVIPFKRPKNLAKDNTPHLPVLRHAVKFMEKKNGFQYDCVVILQPTSPFRTFDDIDKTIKLLIDTNADSSVSLVKIDMNHPIKIKKLKGKRVVPYCLTEKEGVRRQDLPTAYKRSGAVYAIKRDVVVKNNKLYGNYVVGHVVPQDRSIDIDSPLDWIKAEFMLKKLKKKGYKF